MVSLVISQIHLDLIVSVAVDLQLVTDLPESAETRITMTNASAFGKMLWDENIRGIANSCSSEDWQRIGGYRAAIDAYRFRPFEKVKAHAAVKLIAGFEIRIYETPGFETSLAFQALQRLRELLPVNVDRSAYEAAPLSVNSIAELAACLEVGARAYG